MRGSRLRLIALVLPLIIGTSSVLSWKSSTTASLSKTLKNTGTFTTKKTELLSKSRKSTLLYMSSFYISDNNNSHADKNCDVSSKDNVKNIRKKIRVLGVCGGIGSGKSMVCKLLVEDLGCVAHIDTDSVAHNVYIPNSPVLKEIAQEFGSDVLVETKCDDGTGRTQQTINRKKLGSIVFSDPLALSRLERLVWPHVKREIQNQIAAVDENWGTQQQQQKMDLNDNGNHDVIPFVVVEAAVLLDAGWEDFLDGIWVVTAPRRVALDRLINYRGFSEKDAEKRLDAQESRRGIGNLEQEVNNNVVTAVIENNGNDGSKQELKRTLLQKLRDPSAWRR